MGPSLRMKGRTAGQLVSSLSLLTVFLLVALLGAESRVILMHKNESVSFGSREASFAPQVPGSGICGFLFSGKPLNACSTFQDKASFFDGPCSPFVLVMRGNCSFETKIRHAQDAGFGAVIVFDDEDGDDLVAMAGNWEGIWIYAVFVSKAAAQELSHYSDDFNTECWILPANEIIPLSNGIVIAISLFAVALMCGTCLIFRLNRGHHGDGGQLIHEESYGISNQIVKAMPTVIFKGTADVNGTVDTCTICLEDYEAGAKLRILPCHHRFHVFCIDPWLTKWRPFCPLCKRDARVDFNNPPASESTPLLNSSVLGQQVSTAGGGDIQASAPQALPIQIPRHLSDTNLGSVHSLSPSQNVQVVSSHRLTPHSTSLCNLSPMVAPDASRHPSLQSLGGCKPSALSTADLGSLEAFRASPYFTPPSLFRRPSASYLPEHFGGSCNSTPQASDCHLATSFV